MGTFSYVNISGGGGVDSALWWLGGGVSAWFQVLYRNMANIKLHLEYLPLQESMKVLNYIPM